MRRPKRSSWKAPCGNPMSGACESGEVQWRVLSSGVRRRRVRSVEPRNVASIPDPNIAARTEAAGCPPPSTEYQLRTLECRVQPISYQIQTVFCLYPNSYVLRKDTGYKT